MLAVTYLAREKSFSNQFRTTSALIEWTCSEVDLLDLTPKNCYLPDRLMCEIRCSIEGSACEYLCGESCQRGEGALCVYEHLSNLEQTCASIANMTFTHLEFHGRNIARSPRMIDCDYFAYCSYCADSDECSQLVQKPEIPDVVAEYAVFMLNNTTELCATV